MFYFLGSSRIRNKSRSNINAKQVAATTGEAYDDGERGLQIL